MEARSKTSALHTSVKRTPRVSLLRGQPCFHQHNVDLYLRCACAGYASCAGVRARAYCACGRFADAAILLASLRFERLPTDLESQSEIYTRAAERCLERHVIMERTLAFVVE